MNLPNKLTILRVILIPVFVFFCVAGFIPFHMFFALGVFVIASVTDFLDGYIARKKKLITNFGKFMDPLADKLLVVSALICLLIVDGGSRIGSSQVLSMIAILVIVGREFVISGIRLVASDAGVVIAASMWGKVKTASTMVAICFMLVVEEFPVLRMVTTVLFWIAVTLTVVSLIDYVAKNLDVMKDTGKKKKKTPAKTADTAKKPAASKPREDKAVKEAAKAAEAAGNTGAEAVYAEPAVQPEQQAVYAEPAVQPEQQTYYAEPAVEAQPASEADAAMIQQDTTETL